MTPQMKLFGSGIAGAIVAKFALKKSIQMSAIIGLATLGAVAILTAKTCAAPSDE